MANAPIRKAVFPVAGLGTRFLPATKANPKEMLPIVDKPLIQYAVEEAIAAGITQLIFVTSSSKRAIEDHFDGNHELEAQLANRGQQDLLQVVRDIRPPGVSCVYVRQPEPRGLGNAVLCAREVVGDAPFAVLLADDLIDGGTRSCLQQMMALYQYHGGNVIAVEAVDPKQTHKYGIVDAKPESERVGLLNGIVEKPRHNDAPSRLAVAGRYILDPAVFDYLRLTSPGCGGEVQLTDAILMLLKDQATRCLEFVGTRYDCGSKLGYIHATLAYALRHPEIGAGVHALVKTLRKKYDGELTKSSVDAVECVV